jgi:hypothetical protein
LKGEKASSNYYLSVWGDSQARIPPFVSIEKIVSMDAPLGKGVKLRLLGEGVNIHPPQEASTRYR